MYFHIKSYSDNLKLYVKILSIFFLSDDWEGDIRHNFILSIPFIVEK